MIDKINKFRDCKQCCKIKNFNEFDWDYRRNIPRSVCKKCTKQKNRDWYDQNKEEISIKNKKKYQKENKEKIEEKNKRILLNSDPVKKAKKNRDQYKKYKK